MNTGLVSVTFRNLSTDEIIKLVSKAGLGAIEWGSDVHVPNAKTAREVKKKCEDKGILTPSYGSYYRCCVSKEDFEMYAQAAAELKSDTVRIWAGDVSSLDADLRKREEIIADAVKAADTAKKYGLKIAFEFHNGTLTDYADSAVKLIDEIGRDNALLYWQPLNMHSDEVNLNNLITVLPKLSNIHAFGNQSATVPMEQSYSFWEKCRAILEKNSVMDTDRTAYLEFVKDGTAEQFFADAEVLKRIFK